MRHKDIWRGLSQLAACHGLSASGLAERGGPDPTSFNPPKREDRDGQPCWPATESLARVPDAVGEGFDDFAALVDGRRGGLVPLIRLAQAGQDGFFGDAGFPVGAGLEETRSPGLCTGPVYALRLSADMLEPACRAADRIFASPERPSETRRPDRAEDNAG